jgi:hypothetical protein
MLLKTSLVQRTTIQLYIAYSMILISMSLNDSCLYCIVPNKCSHTRVRLTFVVGFCGFLLIITYTRGLIRIDLRFELKQDWVGLSGARKG